MQIDQKLSEDSDNSASGMTRCCTGGRVAALVFPTLEINAASGQIFVSIVWDLFIKPPIEEGTKTIPSRPTSILFR